MLTTLVVIVFTVAIVGALAVAACSCGDRSAAPPQQTWWRAKGLSVYAEPVCRARRAAEDETTA